jgi:carbamoyl-phosphate synthase large subunit
MLNILLTSVGRRVELLRAFRRAYERLSLAGSIVATDTDALAPALQLADVPVLVPPTAAEGYLRALVGTCERERIGLVLPLIDPDIPVLARNRERIEATGARLAVVSDAAATVTMDKWLTAGFFRDIGLATPPSWLPGQLDPGSANYPLIIKPRTGSAGQNVFRATNSRELAFFSDYVSNCIVQEFLPGPEITSDVACDTEGRVLAIVSRRRIQVRGGEVSKGVTIHDERIISACTLIASKLPAIGPMTVQCMMRDDAPVYTEINARLGGGLPLSIAAGVDIPAMLLASTARVSFARPRIGDYVRGLYMTRFEDSFFLGEDNCDAMEGHRI